jgi:hypothetical protein
MISRISHGVRFRVFLGPDIDAYRSPRALACCGEILVKVAVQVPEALL